MGEKVKDQLHKICELKIFPLQTPLEIRGAICPGY